VPELPLSCLLDGLHATYRGCDPGLVVRGVAVDSRAVRPGNAFLALVGQNHDGHRFLDEAMRRQACVAIVRRDRVPNTDEPLVIVEDTTLACARIAANLYGWPARQLRLAGVTGTNGKTTTAHLVSAMLTAARRHHGRLGTTGDWLVDHVAASTLTTPFPMDLQARFADVLTRGGSEVVMEVSSHALAQGRIDALSYACVGLTNLTQDHLDFHVTMEAYFSAKLLLAARYLRHDGVAVALIDDAPHGDRFLAAAREHGATAWSASTSSAADIQARLVHMGDHGMSAHVDTPAGSFAFESPLVGSFNLDNVLVAIAMALALDVPQDAMIAALREFRGAPGRLERVSTSGVAGPLVLVDYAHTPDAVRRVLAAVRASCRGTLHVVLGCGGDRDPAKRPHMGSAAAHGADRFYATSDNPRSEAPERIIDMMLAGVPPELSSKVIRECDRREAIRLAIHSANEHDVVVIAGKGHEDYQLVGNQRLELDDRREAEAALRARAAR